MIFSNSSFVPYFSLNTTIISTIHECISRLTELLLANALKLRKLTKEIVILNKAKKCFIVLERLDEKSLKNCLQKHGLKLASHRNSKLQMTANHNNCSISKKSTKRERKKRNPDDVILERRKKNRIKPLCYTDDESCSESSEVQAKLRMGSQVLSEFEDDSASSNKFDKIPLQSEPDGVSCDKIPATRESTTVSSESEVREELLEDGRKSESQLKNEVRLQHGNVCSGRTDNREISSTVDRDVEIIKVCEKPCEEKQSSTSLSNKKKELIVDSESIQLIEFEDDDFDSREDGEDERETVILEEEFQKDMDLEGLIEFEGKEMSKKFNNREITNRKRQRLVKFKKKSMAGRNLAKIERKPKSKILEGPGSGQETSEKSNECISEECLKEVCGLVKRLHELSRIIALLQRELPNNEEMTVHFNRVINAEQENFHREIRKGQKTIIKCYEKMLSFYSETSLVALEIGKRTSLSVEDVVNVISLCILIEGHSGVEKSRNAVKSGNYPTTASPDCLKNIINDNFMKAIKKRISQRESLGSTPKQPRLQNKISSSFAFPSPHSNQQKHQTVNRTAQPTEHQKHCNLPPLKPQQAIDNFTFPNPQPRNVAKQKLNGGTCFPPLKLHNVSRSPGSPFSRPNSHQIFNNLTGVPTSQPETSKKRKEVNSTGFFLTDLKPSQQTVNNFIGFPPLQNAQPHIRVSFSQSNTHQTLTSTDFPLSEPIILKKFNQPPSQPNNTSNSYDPSKQKKKTSQVENLSILPKGQIVKNPTGSRPNNPSGNVNRHPVLLNRPFNKPFKPHASEKAVHSSDRQITSSGEPHNNLEIIERHKRPNRTLQKCITTSGLGQHRTSPMSPPLLDKAASHRPIGNQPAALDGVVYSGASIQNGGPSRASTHRVNLTVGDFPQRNTLPVSSASIGPSVGVLLLKHPENKPLESNKNPTCRVGGLQSSEFPSVTASKDPVNYTKQTIPPSAAKCPLTPANFIVSTRMLDNSKLLKTHMELDRRNCSATIAVKNSQNVIEQGVLDPTIPQKLTMKNSRLQAGPVLNFQIHGAEVEEKSIHSSTETEKTCNELGNSGREKSQSRVYVCARDDCRNPGVRICNGCHSIIYCSATCQFKHWVQKHKAECYQLRALRD